MGHQNQIKVRVSDLPNLIRTGSIEIIAIKFPNGYRVCVDFPNGQKGILVLKNGKVKTFKRFETLETQFLKNLQLKKIEILAS